jgi:hypothetical protein
MGNASQVEGKELEKDLGPILCQDEPVEFAFKLVRDLIVFTDRRLVLIEKQGLTGKKASYRTVPYRAITQFSIETAGSFDMDAEMIICIAGQAEAIKLEFKKGSDLPAVQRVLARFVCR